MSHHHHEYPGTEFVAGTFRPDSPCPGGVAAPGTPSRLLGSRSMVLWSALKGDPRTEGVLIGAMRSPHLGRGRGRFPLIVRIWVLETSEA